MTIARRIVLTAAAALWLLMVSACNRQPVASSIAAAGLGEIMSLQQMRHTKLWLAGEVGNWDLAAYEVDELGEGFDDVVKFHTRTRRSSRSAGNQIPNPESRQDSAMSYPLHHGETLLADEMRAGCLHD